MDKQQFDTTVASSSFEELAAGFAIVVGWINSFGLDVERSRFGRYVASLSNLVKNYKDPTVDLTADFKGYVSMLYEVRELLLMHEGLAGKYDDQLRAQLRFVTGGPTNYTDENIAKSGNHARNIAFELSVQAKLAQCGIPLRFHQTADVCAFFARRNLIIECKRPHSIKGLSANVKDAYRQLEGKYSGLFCRRLRGIIAIDATKLINPDFNYLQAQDHLRLQADSREMLQRFVDGHERTWDLGRNSRTVSVLAQLRHQF